MFTFVFLLITALPTPAMAATGSGSNTATLKLAKPQRPIVSTVLPNAGPNTGGQSITVSGGGFVNGAKVEIGQGRGAGPTAIVATNVRVVSTGKLTANTGGPAKKGTWNLFVITPEGTSLSNSGDRYTYTRT